MCSHCERGYHGKCWGLVGPMTSHPDSLPRCSCSLAGHPYHLMSDEPGQCPSAHGRVAPYPPAYEKITKGFRA